MLLQHAFSLFSFLKATQLLCINAAKKTKRCARETILHDAPGRKSGSFPKQALAKSSRHTRMFSTCYDQGE